jgi:hypothetical protein
VLPPQETSGREAASEADRRGFFVVVVDVGGCREGHIQWIGRIGRSGDAFGC